ncbi:MAG: hypothetical protein JWQ90_846 [Hydrocarboniphaga sp.]|uniref:nuclear transport factor 2 family protein n=1 Tax=Hydrocarboniphaga sp. TaxID=2033016 RepID=UPI0026259285|nr:nuclear transport factor 2 family protein [Hydrocarboniphaga sp.]MDB5968396.1 hypothetical protein [Hydrocarboniphaga sp.]
MQDNKAVVTAFMRALGSGDLDTLQALITEDIQAVCTGTSVVSGTRHHADICAVAGFLGTVTRGGIDFQILSMTAEDERVSCEVQGYSTLVNGTAYNNQYHFLFFIRDRRVFRIREYIDTKLADEALGPLLQIASA